jgi:hypothetical protein
MTHAEALARRIVDEFPELAGLDRARKLYVRDRIVELAMDAIDDAIEAEAADGEPGLLEGDA